MAEGFHGMRGRRIEDEKAKTLPQKIKYTAIRLFYILSLLWGASKVMMIGLVLISVIEGVLPLLNAYISSQIINELVTLFGTKDWAAMRPIIILLLLQVVYLIFSRVTSRIKGTLTSLSGEQVSSFILVRISKKTKEVDLSNFDLPSFYEKLENASREASTRPVMILTSTLSLFSNLVSTISFIILLGSISPFIPLAVFLLALPSAIINFKYRKVTFEYIRSHSKERRKMTYFTSTLTDKDRAKEIKLLHLTDTFVKRYLDIFAEYYKGRRRIFIREDVLHILVYVISTLCNGVFFLFIAYKVCFDGVKVGDYTLYAGALNSILSGIATMVTNSSSIYEGTLFIDNMIDYMNVKPAIVPLVSPPLLPAHKPHTIEFCDVSFAYPGSDRAVIKHVNLKLSAGKSYILVGLNGAGKTTLIKLMTRLYDPTEGRILLDGEDIRNYDVDALYEMFGIVFQDFSKFAVSAKENITFGDIRRPYEEERLRYAAKQSCADEFLDRLPNGIETPLMRFFEDNAVDLSIGQWQKMSIARAFYKEAECLILDEPTASLDPMAEAEIFRQFDELHRSKTTVFVSHRLSSATTVDQIIVMQRGEVIEQGSHKELMERKGTYYNLFTLQAEKYLENS